MIPVPLAARTFKNRSLPASTINLINLYTESLGPDTKYPAVVHRVPGLPLYKSVGSGPIRGLHVMDGVLYVVSGTELYSVTTSGTSTLEGTVLGSGRVGMASNDRETGPQLVITNGTTTAYVYTVSGGLTTTTLTGPAYTVTYQDGYFIYDWTGTGKWFISSVSDGTTYDSLETGATNARPDDVLAVVSNHEQMWIFGSETIEIFYNSGLLDFPFTRISEATNDELGLANRDTLVELDNTIYWVGQDRNGAREVYRAVGYNAQQISDPSISELLKEVDISQLTAFAYSRAGHKFYQLNLPNISVVYDTKENVWHQRGWFDNGAYYRDRSDIHVSWNGLNITGDHQNGNLYQMSDGYHFDAMGNYLRWEMITPPIPNISRMYLEIEAGQGLTTGQGSDPKMFLSSSDDARVFGNEKWIGVGKKGEYKNKALANRLGRSRNQPETVFYKWAGSDPIKTTLIGCQIEP